jgi:perosamine synthetase
MAKVIKRIPYGRQWIGPEEIRAVVSVLKSDYLTQGPKIQEFENAIASAVGAKYAIAVANGTAALHLAAKVLNLKPGDEVITTPISFLATSNAALYVGAKPIFVDIEPTTQCIDPRLIEKKITAKTKAIFVTDFAGHPADMKSISAIAKNYGLFVVEDAAHALGSTYNGVKVGSCLHADMTIFSFHPVKHITTGEGGAITTNNRKFHERLCDLRTHGVTRDPRKLLTKGSGAWYYEMRELGFNYRMTEIQAVLGIEQLKKLKGFVARRRNIARTYNRSFSDLAGILTPVELPGMRHAYHIYVIRLGSGLADQRKAIFTELQRCGLGVQVHYIPIPSQPYYRERGYRSDDCPKAVNYYRSAISLPMYSKMTDGEVDRVVRIVREVVGSYS